jgi:hypothetical protein
MILVVKAGNRERIQSARAYCVVYLLQVGFELSAVWSTISLLNCMQFFVENFRIKRMAGSRFEKAIFKVLDWIQNRTPPQTSCVDKKRAAKPLIDRVETTGGARSAVGMAPPVLVCR